MILKSTIFWEQAPNLLAWGGKILSTGFARGAKILEPALIVIPDDVFWHQIPKCCNRTKSKQRIFKCIMPLYILHFLLKETGGWSFFSSSWTHINVLWISGRYALGTKATKKIVHELNFLSFCFMKFWHFAITVPNFLTLFQFFGAPLNFLAPLSIFRRPLIFRFWRPIFSSP